MPKLVVEYGSVLNEDTMVGQMVFEGVERIGEKGTKPFVNMKGVGLPRALLYLIKSFEPMLCPSCVKTKIGVNAVVVAVKKGSGIESLLDDTEAAGRLARLFAIVANIDDCTVVFAPMDHDRALQIIECANLSKESC